MYKVGIIGTGRIAFLLENDKLRMKPCTHAGAIIKNNRLKIVAACDRNKERLSLFQKKYKVPHIYTNYKTLLRKEPLDILVIATWTDSHAKIVQEASQSGIPLIICEKPLTSNVIDGEKMIRVCKKNNTLLLVNHERRYDPLYQSVQKMIKNNTLGQIQTVNANVLTERNFNKKSFLKDRSTLLHDATHLIDIALFLFGDINNIKGFIPPYRKDSAYALFEFKNGIILFLEASGDRDYFNFELDIQGTKGRIRVGNEYKELWIKKRSKQYEGFKELERVPFPPILQKNPFIELYKEVIQLLEKKIISPRSSGGDGLWVLRMMDKIDSHKIFK